jgi:hypothetical protein
MCKLTWHSWFGTWHVSHINGHQSPQDTLYNINLFIHSVSEWVTLRRFFEACKLALAPDGHDAGKAH